MRSIFFGFLLQALVFSVSAQNDYNPSVVSKIKGEAEENLQVMDIAFHLTDVTDPRLTASPGFMNAANWAKTTLQSWGLTNVNIEPWGDFGKGWQQEHCYVAMTKPSLIFTPFSLCTILWKLSKVASYLKNVQTSFLIHCPYRNMFLQIQS